MPRPDSRHLPPTLLQEMEMAFGDDFSDVRIQDPSSKPVALGAKAYAIGNEIHFAPGAYDGASPETKKLLAHELAHIVQQRKRGRCDSSLADRAMNEEKAEQKAAQAMGRIVTTR